MAENGEENKQEKKKGKEKQVAAPKEVSGMKPGDYTLHVEEECVTFKHVQDYRDEFWAPGDAVCER